MPAANTMEQDIDQGVEQAVRQAMKQAMARVPGPVTIVTTVDAQGEPWGFTASSFCSLSMDPPLLLVCLDKGSASSPAFQEADSFLVNVLAEDQAGPALSFGRAHGPGKFADSGMEPCEGGLPGLPAAAARLSCRRHAVLDGGDHSILVGRVVDVSVEQRTPLVYWDRRFASPLPHSPVSAG
jgi:flavin reductase ActVB